MNIPTLAALLLVPAVAFADGMVQNTVPAPQAERPTTTVSQTEAEAKADAGTRRDNRSMSQGAKLSATLVDKEANAKRRAATIQVRVNGVQLGEGRAHLHYKIDDGPIIDTHSTKLGFQDLAPGQHGISVMLANDDHSALGPSETLSVTIP